MTLLVVLILVVLWAAVLGPVIVRRLRDEEPVGSVDSFYHELHLLERAAPKTVAPANRLEMAYAGGAGPGSSGYPSVSSMPGRPSLVLLRPVGPAGGDLADRSGPAPTALGQPDYRELAVVPGNGPNAGYGPGVRAPTSLAARDHAYRVRQCRRRRRDIVLGLLATVVVTGPLGAVHSFRTLWVFTVLSAVLLVAYVYLLVRVQEAAMARRGRVAHGAPPVADRGTAGGGRQAVDRGHRQPIRRADRQAAAGQVSRRAAAHAHPGTRPVRPSESEDEREDEGYEEREDPVYLGRLAAMGEPGWWEHEGAREEAARAARAGYPGSWDDELEPPPVYAAAPRRVAAGG